MTSQVLSLALLSLAILPFTLTANLKEIFKWKELDFKYSTPEEREAAISSGNFIVGNPFPLGMEVYNNKVFITVPRWMRGVPATLAYVPRPANFDGPPSSPALIPYPNWEWNRENSGCDAFSSVFRVWADTCGRLWVIDAGRKNAGVEVCPPQIVVFDLNSDTLIRRYKFPNSVVKCTSSFSNIHVDVRNDANGRPMCDDAFAYVPDLWGFGVVVYSFRNNRSWRVDHEYFMPDPLFCKYTVGEFTFRWMDGIFSIALGPVDPTGRDRYLYFHAMSSSTEFRVPASVMQNETNAKDNPEKFEVLSSRGINGQSSASAMDKNGILFYNLVTLDAVACWNSKLPYKKPHLGLVEQNPVTLRYPSDLTVDQGGLDGWPVRRTTSTSPYKQNVWVFSNRMPTFRFGKLDKNDFNFRVLAISVEEAIRNNVCQSDYA